jgi:hypothetical protein
LSQLSLWNSFGLQGGHKMNTLERNVCLKLVKLASAWSLCFMAASVSACDLCAVYSANNARGESSSGFVATLSEQFTRLHTVQFQGEPLPSRSILDEAYLDNSMAHVILGYNFSSRVGISVNTPIVHRQFKRFEVRPTGIASEEGSVSGIGDLALVGRWTVLEKSVMKSSVRANLLGGVKFPTGDASRVRNEVARGRVFNTLSGGNGHAHEFGGVHEHDLAPGSGSYDGIMGTTLNIRWRRWYFDSLFQYYARTEGEDSFKFGNTLMVSGGPGAYLLLDENYTLSLQANAAYETQGRNDFLGSKSNNTGMTAWYLGPQLSFTWGQHLSANAGVDVPLRIANNGLQNIPDYRIHAGLTWRF